jgi:magnesium chelatase family protein
VQGVLPAALAAREAGRALVLPRQNAIEAGLVRGLRVLPADHLLEVCAHLNGEEPLETYVSEEIALVATQYPDLSEVRGQPQAKRALEIAAAGGHSLLLLGPPGTGKSMLASRLPGLLPTLSEEEALQTAAIRSVSGLEAFDPARWRQRPFRTPHHSASGVALVGGGGNPPRPGEISQATPRRAVSRRTAGVRPPGPGGTARAPGVRPHHTSPAPRARPSSPPAFSSWRP